jgi:CheY-like chemotaxis protein
LVANHENSSFRVLVVEDNPINQKVALSLLNKLGYRADTAANGVIALQRMQEQEYDLLLMDFQMPEMDGPEASMRIRAGQSGINRVNIPIVAMTANAMKTDRERCEEAGMDDFLAKPLLLDELAKVMQRWHQRLEAKS